MIQKYKIQQLREREINVHESYKQTNLKKCYNHNFL